jgi:hypothetical protein
VISVQDRWDLEVASSGSWMRGYGVWRRKEAVALGMRGNEAMNSTESFTIPPIREGTAKKV